MILYPAGLLFLLFVSLSYGVGILKWPPLTCSQQGLRCTVDISNCMDSGWLVQNNYTPSGPEDLEVTVDTRRDERGDLLPVLVAHWKIKDDGSISYLKATEFHVLVIRTNQNLCVRYSFQDELPMRNPSGEKWSFSADMVVVEPGHEYRVSVFNLPKPELGYTGYNIGEDATVPGCQDPKMKWSKFCIERGSLWQPNISLAQITGVQGRPMLAVSFNADELCKKYTVLVSCSTIQHSNGTYKNNQTSLNVTFNLEDWPRTCCQFDVEIKPHFPQCHTDCTRRRGTFNICGSKPIENPTEGPNVPGYAFIALGVVLLCVVMGFIKCVLCRRKPDQPGVAVVQAGGEKQHLPEQPPKVLVIYSQDHRLYRDIVLKLCAFLRAKCGTEVLVDLLDSTSVGTVGRLRWLEWQRRQLKNPSDKILVLCSRGVQAKWRAMCGQGQVTLREDVLSHTDDMLIPFLNLFLPDMHQAGMLGKYMVAYFNDVSSEQDVPSVFDIAVKYKLMKHFEELYFRILDIEKYQPGQVNHIEGIGGDEYFNCPSGRALRNAIETFQAYQLENPDWFEMECVGSEEEVTAEFNLLIDQLQIPPVLECVPLIREGLPVYIHEVEINENIDSVHIVTPELNPEGDVTSVMELKPRVNIEPQHLYPFNPAGVLTAHVYPHSPGPEPFYMVEPALNKPPPLTENWLHLEERLISPVPVEDEEEDSLLPVNQLSPQTDQRLPALQKSLNSNPPETPCVGAQVEYLPPPEIDHSQPVEMEEEEVMEPCGKSPSNGSDQGYMSKMSSQHEAPVEEDPLMALARLQEELFERNHKYTEIGSEAS
uniref:interleukin 17 receptor A1a n=1 Tax=Centroberyx gerrardi TaxID=166262 RepID=UPI003AAAA5E8